MGLQQGTPEYRRFIIAIIAAGTATFAQMYSPQGILPLIARDLDITASASSLAVGATTLGVALGVIPWARISDRIGRVTTMRVSIIAAVIIGLVVPFVPGYSAFIALRTLEGLTLAGLPAVALTTINEEMSRRAVGIAAGAYIAGNTFGGLLGRLVAAPAADFGGWRMGMSAVSILALIAAVGFVATMPEARAFTPVLKSARTPITRELVSNLKTPGVLVLFSQAFLLMGGFVAMYNYLAFRLERAPYYFDSTMVSFLFFAYLAGTCSSQAIWRLTRTRTTTGVMVGAIAVTIAGALLTLADGIVLILIGLVVMTGAFFAAHSIASGSLVGRATIGRSQAGSMYNLFYYAGSTVIGWLGGVAYTALGWDGTVWTVVILASLSLLATLLYARSEGGFRAVDANDAQRRI